MKQKSENNREIQKPYHKGTIVLIQIVLEKLANQCFSVPIAGKHHRHYEILEMQAGNFIYCHDFNRLLITK